MKVLSCNLRGFGKSDGENAWIHRENICVDIIRAQKPDIIAFQEMQQIVDMRKAFPDYKAYGMADEPTNVYPMNSIFYRKDAFDCLSAGGYWLSETPHVTGTKSWDSSCVRLANWVVLKRRSTGITFRLINTHLDHISQAARENQARLIVEDSSAYPMEYPQILTGDMNCDHKNKAIDIFKSGGWADTYNIINGTENPGHTFHEFRGMDYESTIGKMDWILTRGEIKTLDATVVYDSRNGKFPSDHFFVGAELE